MKIGMAILLVVLAVVVTLASLNWAAIVTPTEVSLIFASVQAPIGLLLLTLVAVVSIVFLGYLVYLQTSVLLEARRHSRALASQRDIADKAEASRFTDLRGYLATELGQLRTLVQGVESNLKSNLDTSVNSLSAYIGELEDRLEASGQIPPSRDA